jgi:sortase A
MSLDPTPVAPDLQSRPSFGLRAVTFAARRPSFQRVVERVLFATAFVSLGWCAWTLVDAAQFEHRQQGRLNALGVEAYGPPRVPFAPKGAVATRRETRESGLVGRLEIERLGLSAIVAEGIGSRTLRRSVGHVPGSAFPGEPGNVVLAAHRDRHFRPLRKIREGDLVRLTTPDGAFAYRVEFVRVVEAESHELVADLAAPVLTLVTCYPFYFVGDAPQRFVVRARMVTQRARSTKRPSRVSTRIFSPDSM